MNEAIRIPKIADLYENTELMAKTDLLTTLLNQPPNAKWVKEHPYIKNYKYLPINIIEFLLKSIFKKYRIEVLREGAAFNGVYVVVRIHYLNPITEEWDYHDGIGAKELQVKSGESVADLSKINAGALAMAFPIAKTVAIKDACDHFGSLFGADLNRKDIMEIKPDKTLQSKSSVIEEINSKIKTQTAGAKKKTEIEEPAIPSEDFSTTASDETQEYDVSQFEVVQPEIVSETITEDVSNFEPSSENSTYIQEEDDEF